MELSKKQLIEKILPHEFTECHQYFQKLLKRLIQDARERNDTAIGVAEIHQNQGAVKELKQLLKSIQRHEIQRGFDGAYGD